MGWSGRGLHCIEAAVDGIVHGAWGGRGGGLHCIEAIVNVVQDCALLNGLCVKLEIVANNVGMANVCWVPLNFIFMRGQGIKIFSLVSKRCKEDGFVIPVVRAMMDTVDDEGYEGAIVLPPTPGMYMDEPVAVLDYASLYPSSMIR